MHDFEALQKRTRNTLIMNFVGLKTECIFWGLVTGVGSPLCTHHIPLYQKFGLFNHPYVHNIQRKYQYSSPYRCPCNPTKVHRGTHIPKLGGATKFDHGSRDDRRWARWTESKSDEKRWTEMKSDENKWKEHEKQMKRDEQRWKGINRR